MSRSGIVPFFIAVALFLAGYQYWRGVERETTAPLATAPLVTTEPVVSTPGASVDDADAGSGAAEFVTGCLTMDEIRARPLVRELMQRLDAAAVEGDDVETFRGVDVDSVRGFAEQGDAAAMAVTGAILVMQAFKQPEALAVDWLNSGGHLDGIEMRLSPSSEASLILNDAAYWFYEAALNGRVMALQHYGQVRGQVFGGPVGLGWVSQEEYDTLDDEQRNELSPFNMFRMTAIDLVPGSYEEFVRGSNRTPSRSEIGERIRNDIHHEFNVALSNSDLAPPIISAAEATELEELRSQICASE